MKVLTVTRDGSIYKFTDIILIGDHYLAHQIRDDNTIGKMEHRITKEEYENGTILDTDDT